VVGLNIALNPVAFDIASSMPGTVPAVPSANATQPPAGTSATPGVTPPTTSTPAAPQTPSTPSESPLRSLLCSVNGFGSTSNMPQVAQQLNAIIAALANPQGQ